MSEPVQPVGPTIHIGVGLSGAADAVVIEMSVADPPTKIRCAVDYKSALGLAERIRQLAHKAKQNTAKTKRSGHAHRG